MLGEVKKDDVEEYTQDLYPSGHHFVGQGRLIHFIFPCTTGQSTLQTSLLISYLLLGLQAAGESSTLYSFFLSLSRKECLSVCVYIYLLFLYAPGGA